VAAANLLAALWEPMSLGRPCDSAEAVRSFTKRGSAMDARLHTCVRTTAPAQLVQILLRDPLLQDVAKRVLTASGAGCWV
jgi:hypothetical protein